MERCSVRHTNEAFADILNSITTRHTYKLNISLKQLCFLVVYSLFEHE